MAELAPETVKVVDTYWAGLFGCPGSHFSSRDTLVVPHTGLGDYPGVYFFARKDSLLVSTPPERLAELSPRLVGLRPAAIKDLPGLRERIGLATGEELGPLFIGYTDARTFVTPSPTEGVRLLTEADRPALEAMRAACSETDWEYGGCDFSERPVVGQFVGNSLTAVGSYAEWGGEIAHLSVITHPDYRKQGHGKGIVSAVTQEALRRAFVPQYRTRYANAPSLALATSLGFVELARSVAIKLA
jgi:GNAT superfamily N-acetyltransferase